MHPKKWLALALLVAVLARLFVFFSCPIPLTPDVFERARVSERILETGELFFVDDSIAQYPRSYSYPPFSDFALASFGVVGLPLLQSSFALAFLLGIASALLLFLLSREWLSPRSAFFASVLFSFFPLLSIRFHTFVAETMGIMLFLLVLYLLERRGNWVLAGLAFGVLSLTHYRSAFTLAAVFVFAIILFVLLKERKRALDCARALGIAALVFFPWLLFRFWQIVSIREYFNPFAEGLAGMVFGVIASPFSIISLVAFLGLFVSGFLLALFSKNPVRFALLFSISLGILSYLFLSVFGELLPFYSKLAFVEREFAFLVIPAVVFAGFCIQWLDESRFFGGKRALPFAVFLALFTAYFLAFSPAYCFPVGQGAVDAASFAGEHHAGETVMANHSSGFLLACSGNRVVLGAFMEDVPGASERFEDVHSVLHGESPLPLMEKYGASCILLSPGERNPAVESPPFINEFDGKGYGLYCIPAS